MKNSSQLALGISIGIFFLSCQIGYDMYIDYLDSRVINTEYLKYDQHSFHSKQVAYSKEVAYYLERDYNCGFEIHFLSGGGYRQGSEFCSNENETIEIYWDFEKNIMMQVYKDVPNEVENAN